MIDRHQFEVDRAQDLLRMQQDAGIQRQALALVEAAVPHRLVYQTSWMGEPILQLPQDLFAIQEVLYKTRPKYVIEVGVAWAGSLLFYAAMLPHFGGMGVIGIDTYIPEDLKQRLAAKGDLAKCIHLVEGSSTDTSTLAEVQRLTNSSDELFVHLDSDHTASHVQRELEAYGPMIGPGFYLLCGDTHVELLAADTYANKPYNQGNNPMVALRQFLASEEGSAFQVDHDASSRYLLSLNPSGFLVRSC